MSEETYWGGLGNDELPCHICGLPQWQCDGTNSKHWTRADEEACLAEAEYQEGKIAGENSG